MAASAAFFMVLLHDDKPGCSALHWHPGRQFTQALPRDTLAS